MVLTHKKATALSLPKMVKTFLYILKDVQGRRKRY